MRKLVVAAGIIKEAERYLVAKRAVHKAQGGLWEFPGGKIELNESPEKCLERELWEELSIRVKVGAFFAKSIFSYQAVTIELLAYWVDHIDGEILLTEHEEARYVATEDMGTLRFAPADMPIVKALVAADNR
ncbi:MAG: (deoxy)nucleoside triphosphate pyrophosphohydrolase [Candidatus Saccharimonadales bacterium]